MLVALSRDSREAVDAFMEAGLAAGGADADKLQEHGDAMYGRAISDPDGNVLILHRRYAPRVRRGQG